MRELSLFTGAGGGMLATKHLLGWETVGYVEWNEYCQRVIAARIRDGYLDDAPIYGDLRAFIGDGYAAAYTGMVDVISAGFPCQPFSVAGKQRGEDDERNMWPETIECARIIRPRYLFLENVSGLVTSGYFGTILGDLAESGFDCRWRILSASECGAPHKRDRLWIVAYRPPRGCSRNGADVPDTTGNGWRQMEQPNRRGTQGERPEREAASRPGGWWQAEPNVGRVVDELAYRVDRIRSLGNGQVPVVAATAWRLLTEEW